MSDLEGKLRQVIGNYAGVPKYNNRQAQSRLDETVDQIKKVFAEAGYAPIKLVALLRDENIVRALQEAGKEVSDTVTADYMTGAEWLQAYERELELYQEEHYGTSIYIKTALKVARKAAGITE